MHFPLESKGVEGGQEIQLLPLKYGLAEGQPIHVPFRYCGVLEGHALHDPFENKGVEGGQEVHKVPL